MLYVCRIKSTHRGFRGPNNFLLARRTFLCRNRTSFFRRRIDRCRCLDRSRCSKTIENGRKTHSVCYMPAEQNRRIAVFGARTMFCWRAVHFCTEIERRFFDAESIDADASIDRGARKRPKTVEKIIASAICVPNKIDASRIASGKFAIITKRALAWNPWQFSDCFSA